ncbi:MAG TPA: 2OG-Fe(II) oxygenase [Allosphingosinicella sp.]|nr:2OG-Fe(II) oxygenase [Allosphingosinicella sp.]
MSSLHPTLALAFELSSAGRNEEALLLIEQLAEQGEPEALWVLGDVHWRGQLVPIDMPRGRELMRRAAEAAHPIATRAYTNLLASGAAGSRDWQGALARLAGEARGDSRRAQMLALIRRMDLDPEGNPRRVPQRQKVSDSPHILLFPNLFSAAECDYLIEVAEPTFEPSLVADTSGTNRPDPVRTSDGSTMHWLIEDPAIHALNRRLAAVSGSAWEQGEPLQILRYSPGQQYRNHVDYVPGIDNQRIKTALVYLNTDFEGGETAFVKAGLMVKARKGNAIVFRNALPDGRADPMCEHAGLPVTRGVKYLASRWIRERRHIV